MNPSTLQDAITAHARVRDVLAKYPEARRFLSCISAWSKADKRAERLETAAIASRKTERELWNRLQEFKQSLPVEARKAICPIG